MSISKEFEQAPVDWVANSLATLGVATIVADARGRVLFMNSVAESLTAWKQTDAMGQPVTSVFRIVNEVTRESVPDPVTEVLNTGEPFGVSNHILLVGRDGTEWVLNEGAAPVLDNEKKLIGAILLFRDISKQRHHEREIEYARAFAEGILETIRRPIIVLDSELRVRIANNAFYEIFSDIPRKIVGQHFHTISQDRWDDATLLTKLKVVLAEDTPFDEYELERLPGVSGPRFIMCSARRLELVGRKTELILLAIEDITESRLVLNDLSISETRYRRLFETAQDGILLVDPKSRQVFDANPFLAQLIGYSHDELVGRELWEIGLFTDIESNRAAFLQLLQNGYIRYEDLPLLTKDGRHIDVEFVSNVYEVGDTQVIQCNIRDVTDRKQAELSLHLAYGDLENRVRERTLELSNEIIRREKAEAERRVLQGRLATAQEDERCRIARELHDQMGQTLTGLSLGLKLVVDSMPSTVPMWSKIQNLQRLTDQMSREVHLLALELRPTALDDLGLHAAIANYNESWTERSGIHVDFQSNGVDGKRLSAEIETALYRVIQESLTNILKHASARNASVILLQSQNQILVIIEDDGRGFNAEEILTTGSYSRRLGIVGMQERMALINGTLSIESIPGIGTTVIVRVPQVAEEKHG